MSSSRWELYLIETDGGPASVAVDLAFELRAPVAELPLLHWVRTPPQPEEEGAARAAQLAREERLHELFRAAGGCPVGSISSRERRELYWHAPRELDPGALRPLLAGPPAWLHGFDRDPQWQHYREVLLPREEDRRRMQVVRALAALAERGDLLEVERSVEYRAAFSSREDAQRFLRQAVEAGFRAAGDAEASSGIWRARVAMRHALSLAELAPRIEQIGMLASAYDGRYEGFDTHSVQLKSDPRS
ncbi:MAG: DUF695 domain-containing protein [Planctomycetes bacterium]|nr:DUF695 domain-containing protein [Planctomycetota bacterium]